MKVDLVYLWVDGSDPVWQAKRQSVAGYEGNTSADCKGRYADNGELKYSLRSVELYAPWIRKIFIVTDNQVPEWLDATNPKIQIVDHKEILSPESLPCFNSRIIEHSLFRIPGLAEHFLYANDDMFINSSVTPDDFFDPAGLPIARMTHKSFKRIRMWLKRKVLKQKIDNRLRTIEYAAELVEDKYGVYFGSNKLHHNIDAYNRSDYEHVYDTFKDAILPTLSNHIRKASDVSRHIYTYTPLAEKRAHLCYVDSKTSFRLQIHKWKNYEEMKKCNPVFFCMNDSQFAQDADRERAMEYLKKRFPVKSKFEK